MSKYNIKCIARSGDEDEFFITADSKVWPCQQAKMYFDYYPMEDEI